MPDTQATFIPPNPSPLMPSSANPPDNAEESGAPALTLDAGALDKLRALDPDGRHQVLVRVLQTYAASLDRMRVTLEVARAQGDWRTVERLAHTLKSSSASIGALDFAQRWGDIEARLRDRGAAGVDDIVPAMDRLRTDGDRVQAAVQAMLRSP